MEMREVHWLMDLITHMDIGLVVFDREGRVKLWNHFMENHSGFSSTEMRGRCLWDLYPELKAGWFQHEMESVLLLDSEVFITWEQVPHLFPFKAYRPLTGDADKMFQNLVMRAIRNPSGKVELVSMTLYDVTDIAVNQRELESANNTLAQLSRTDRLTGLFNRGYWQEQLEHHWSLYKRYQQSCSLVIFDIDHFKNINDSYGHQAGDEVIRQVAQMALECARENDCVGRYGGEEFTILLPHTDQAGARYFAERLRTRVEKLAVQHEDQSIGFTISLGVAELGPQYGSETVWLEAADQALYQSKRGGRNQVSVAAE